MERPGEPEAAGGGRRAPLILAAVPGAVAFLAVGALGAADGGFFPTSWGWATLALLWVGLAALLLRPRVELSRREASFLALLLVLLAWTALSSFWSWSVPLSLQEVQRDLIYVSGAAALLLAGTRASGLPLAAGVLAAVLFLTAANLALRLRGTEDVPGGEAVPIGYANGLGLLSAIGVVLAVGLARTAAPRARRVGLLALAAVPAAALALSGSRGAWVALAVGLLAMLALARGPASAFPAVVAAGVALALVAGYAYGSERERYWTVALAQAESAPLHGTGAGTFERVWLQERPEPLLARDAHGLYVETLAELGIVGLALLLGLLALPVAAAVAGRGEPGVAAAAGAFAAFVVHAGVDWQWELPAVTLAGLACGLVPLLAAGRADVVVSGRGRAAAVAVTAGLGALAFLGLVGQSALAEGYEALRAGRPAAAERLAHRAARVHPWSAEARLLEGEARAADGRQVEARSSFRRALELDQGDPDLWRALASVAEGEERRRALEQAALLDPLGGAG